MSERDQGKSGALAGPGRASAEVTTRPHRQSPHRRRYRESRRDLRARVREPEVAASTAEIRTIRQLREVVNDGLASSSRVHSTPIQRAVKR